MISKLTTNTVPQGQRAQSPQNPRVKASALKVFEEAGGVSDSFVPGLGDHYEDLAADFLENWLVNDSTPSFEAPAEKAVEPEQQQPAITPEPQLTSFSLDLDWQLSDQFKVD